MNNFEINENKGRTLLKTFLDQVGATEQHESTGKYDPVDYYFSYKGKTVVAEIKVRDKKYEDYPTHLIELSKYKALIKDMKDNKLDVAYYINFFVDKDTVTTYFYSTSTIRKYAIRDNFYCNKTTAVYSGKKDKDVLLIPTDKAQIFIMKNNRWCKSN